ncbi:PREDICTED: breast cancer type 2 susceptibility protein homolog [Amphimedon queenslandica]|nr:PREDICTED: breast cancer type 2 susceptibility protein homolog [Amphimedon queenslandica]|eukprot:XP_019862481.1 PREDICTED: breast cancer type 2 susceptibility protein homolog [Amphimedon queenslandica]
MAAADSFSSLLKDKKSLSPFCLVHSLQGRPCPSDDGGEEEEEKEEDRLNQSSLSVSLFESPHSKLPPSTVQPIRTPSNNVATPLTLQVDCVDRVWSSAMATPTSKKSHFSSISELGTSCSSIDQSEREKEKRGEREIRERARNQGSEIIVRRLFHSQPEATPNLHNDSINKNDDMISDVDLNHTHNSMDLFHDREEEYLETSPQLMLSGGPEHSLILPEHVEEDMEEDGKENLEIFYDSLLTQGTQPTPILEVKGPEADACISPSKGSCEDINTEGMETNASPEKGSCTVDPILEGKGLRHMSLDVLFMSNSQLDAIETKPLSQDHTQPKETCQSNEAKREAVNEIQSESVSLKRIHSPESQQLNKKSKSLQPLPQLKATPTLGGALSDNQLKRKMSTFTGYQTPLSRPKPSTSSFKVPRPRGEVNEREERQSIERVLSSFNPLSTSTPSVVKAQGVRSLFKTGSGKDLMISDHSIEKAKLIFDDEEKKNDEGGKTDLMKVDDSGCDQGEESGCGLEDSEGWTVASDFDWEEFNTFTQLPGDTVNGPSTNQNEDPQVAMATVKTPPIFGFKNASGRDIAISSKALTFANNLLSDEMNATPTTVMPILSTSKGLHEANPISYQIGFKTAGGKDVTISKKSLETAKRLLSDDPNIHEAPPTSATPISGLGFTTASGKNVNVSTKSLEIVKKLFEDDEVTSKPTNHLGFSTASGKEVPVSSQSLSVVRNLFSEDAMPNITNPGPSANVAPPTNIGFTTAGGKRVDISEKSLQAVRRIFADEETPPTKAPPISTSALPIHIGFTTASGKGVDISEKSLEAVRGIFADDENASAIAPPANRLGFTTGSGKEVSVSDESLKTIRRLFSDEIPSEPPPTRVIGFSTASGKGVSVSTESLEAVKNMFSDHHDDKVVSISDRSRPSSEAATVMTPSISRTSDTWDNNSTNVLMTPNLGLKTTPFAPPTKVPERTDSLRKQATSRRGRVSRPESLLCDRNSTIKAKRAICQDPKTTPIATPSHIKFQKETPNSMSSKYRRPKRINPVWEGDLSSDLKRSQPTTPPPSSPLTPSQLSSFTNLSPLSPGTLNSSRLNINDSLCNAPPPPVLPRSPGQVVQGQEGTITRARGRPGCQRIPLIAMAMENGRLGGYSEEELLSKGVCPSVLSVSVSNASSFVFEGRGFFSPASLRRGWVCVGDGVVLKLSERNTAGAEELWSAFSLSPGVDDALISKDWFTNHYKWIVWKLATMEICFPEKWAGRCLTVDWCLLQLKYRYDIEIDQAKRSIIHKICEGDDTPTRHMILCVCHMTQETNASNEVAYSLELTDGWYSIPAKLDRPLSSFAARGLICVGGKLAVFGAELSGDQTNGHPLEVSKSKLLLLNANSVRRAHWSARLGLLPHPVPPSFPLQSIIPARGIIPAIEVIIARCYPLLYVERGSSDGDGRGFNGRVFRRRHEEERVEREWEEKRQKKMEEIYKRVEKEYKEEVESHSRHRKRRSSRVSVRYVKQLQDGEEIYNQLQSSSDPDSFMELLSSTQRTLLESYQVSLSSKKQEELQSRIKKAVEKAGEELPPTRNVSQLLRLVLVQYGEIPSSTCCLLSAWNVGGSEMRDNLKEGVALRISKVSANSNFHDGQLQLSSGKLTSFSLLPKDQSYMINYTQRQFTSLCQLSSYTSRRGVQSQYNEIDTVGIIITTLRQKQFNNNKTIDVLYLTDADKCLLVIKAWEGLKSVVGEGVVTAGCIVAVSNLRYQVGSGLGPPTGHVTDRTIFSQRPIEEHLSKPLDELKQNLPNDISLYLQEMSVAISQSVT